MNDSLFSSSSTLLCSICSSPFKDPRILPCQHSFCLKCIHFLCDNPTTDSNKKIKLVCPKCTTHFTVPSAGVESYPVNKKLQSLKSKIIDEVASNISKELRSSKEGLNKVPSSNSKYNSSSRISSNFQKDETSRPPADMNNKGYSSLNNDYSKYAKYFESNDEKPTFKPTIRPDHTKISYESSTRFRNRQRSKEKDKTDDQYRRRTWYGSTLENRRAQSLSRSSTYTEKTPDPKASDNLYKISEDKEHSSSNPQQDTSSHRHSMYDDYTSINIPTTPVPPPRPTKLPTSTNPSPSKPYEIPFSRRANLGGPSRPTLATHRENIITAEEHRRQSKERKNSRFSPLRGESKFAYKARKSSPKTSMGKEKNQSSPSPSPQRKKISRKEGTSEKMYRRFRESNTPMDGVLRDRGNGGRSGERMDRRQQFMKEKEDKLRQESDSPSAHHHQEQPSSRLHRLKTEVPFEDVQSHKKARPRCRSMDSRPKSLNKNDFKSASEFKNHLLGMTMKKDWYANIMQDFQNGRINNIQEYEEEEDEIDTHAFEDTEIFTEEDKEDKEEDKENQEKNHAKADSVIDETLITSLRAKYSSSLYTKKFPKRTSVLKLGEGVSQLWSYQKNDQGLPASAVFLPSGSLVVADYGQSCLEFLDPLGHFEHSITGIKPFGMTINRSSNSIIVGDRKGRSIRIFDEFGADVSQIDNFNSVEWLGGMGLKQDGGLVLCDRSKSCIIVCSASGEKVREFGSYGLSSKQLCMADFLAVDSKDRVIIADSGILFVLNE